MAGMYTVPVPVVPVLYGTRTGSTVPVLYGTVRVKMVRYVQYRYRRRSKRQLIRTLEETLPSFLTYERIGNKSTTLYVRTVYV